MPEQLTKHPEVTLQVLRSAGAKCGEGASPDILTKCPAERLCKLPGGEICIFGVAEAQHMTQLTSNDWQSLAGLHKTSSSAIGGETLLVSGIGVGVIVGALLSFGLSRLSRKRP
jgi:hypothetical protein